LLHDGFTAAGGVGVIFVVLTIIVIDPELILKIVKQRLLPKLSLVPSQRILVSSFLNKSSIDKKDWYAHAAKLENK
jgi:hypothetical protein